MLNSAMMSFDGAGRIRSTTALPKNFNGGTPMNGDLLCGVVAAPVNFMGGLGYDVSGALAVFNGTPTQWSGGIPLDASGRVCVDATGGATPVSWVSGLPLTADGKLALTAPVAPSTASFSSGFDEGFS